MGLGVLWFARAVLYGLLLLVGLAARDQSLKASPGQIKMASAREDRTRCKTPASCAASTGSRASADRSASLSQLETDAAAAPTVEDLLASPSVSNWLKEALRSALARDPVDAAQDAGVLHLVLSSRADAILI